MSAPTTISFSNRRVGEISEAGWIIPDLRGLGRRAFPDDIANDGDPDWGAYWASLLPDGLSRNADPQKLVAAMGGDLFGAFAFSGDEEARPITWPDISRMAERQLEEGGSLRHDARAVLPGACPKLPVAIKGERILTPGFHSASTHILHMVPGTGGDARARILNQALVMSAARRVELPVVYTRLQRDPYLLISARFDRGITARGQVLRRHALNGAQLLSCSNLGEGIANLKAVFHLINTVSSRPAADKLHLLRQLIFNQLCGVDDFHARSIAFLVSATGIQLAPAQGLYSSALHAGSPVGFSIGGCQGFEWMRADHWIRLAQDAGVAPGLVFTEIRRMAKKLESCLTEAAKELCKSRLELDFASGLLSLVKARTLRCADFVLLAEHQKVPWIQGKRRQAVPTPETVAPRAGDEGGVADWEPIYE
jgi:hypothetical protein